MVMAERRKGEHLEQNDHARAGCSAQTNLAAAERPWEDGAGCLLPSGQRDPLEAWVGKSLH